MQSVLCFGDSLTWGSDPATRLRHPPADRWPNVLAAGLPGVEVITEGLRGRLTAYDNGAGPCDLNGARVLPMVLHSHAPLDVVVVMLGLNDIWQGYRPDQVQAGLRRLVEIIRTHPSRPPGAMAPDILLAAQPPMVPGQDPAVSPALIAASGQLSPITAAVAQETGVPWADMASVTQASPVDCVHVDAPGTRAMGEALVAPVRALLAARR